LIVLFVPCALIWIFWSKRWREVRWLYIIPVAIVGLLCCSPVIYWNWKHEWASFAFQLGHGLKSDVRDSSWPIAYLLGQVGLLFPPIIWFATRRKEPRGLNWLHVFGWFPLAFFFYTSFKARVEANWPIMAHPEILTLAFLNMTTVKELKWLKATMACWIVALLIIVSEIVHPWIPVDPKHLKTSEYHRFDIFIPEVERAKAENIPLYFCSYQTAGALSYKFRHVYYKLNGMNRRDFFDFVPESIPTAPKFWVANEIGSVLPDWIREKGYVLANTRLLNDRFMIYEVEKRAQAVDQ
jgi:hypothetical protein